MVNLVARTTDRRRAACGKIRAHGVPFATLVHPAVDTLGAELGRDVIVYENAIVSPEARVGEGSVLFMGAVAGHESRLGELCVMAAGSVLNARVVLEDRVYVGTNAAILPEITIGEGATIGSCSAVIQDVPAGATAVGVPAEVLARSGDDATRRGASDLDVDEIEEAIHTVWTQLLGASSIGSDESFFDAGGTSLLALRARTRIEEAIGVELVATDLFRFPTLRGLANHLARRGDEDAGAGRERVTARREAVRVLRRRERRPSRAV